MTERQEDVRDALRRMYGLDVTYLESRSVEEMLDLEVHIFAIHGHLEAVKVYAWSYELEGEIEYAGVLHLSPVASPLNAILARISKILSDS